MCRTGLYCLGNFPQRLIRKDTGLGLGFLRAPHKTTFFGSTRIFCLFSDLPHIFTQSTQDVRRSVHVAYTSVLRLYCTSPQDFWPPASRTPYSSARPATLPLLRTSTLLASSASRYRIFRSAPLSPRCSAPVMERCCCPRCPGLVVNASAPTAAGHHCEVCAGPMHGICGEPQDEDAPM